MGMEEVRPRHSRSPRWAWLVGLLLVWVLAGCSPVVRLPLLVPRSSPAPGVSAPLARFYHQTLAWRSCGGGFQCATLRVPLDYAHPDRRTIQIAVVRKPAGDPAHRLGSLLLNPGGPGASGIDYARAASDVVSPELLARYDIVGFDPRGVGQSTPVACLSDGQLDVFNAADPDPQTPAAQDQVVAEDRLFASQCEAHSGDLLPFLSTRDAARDMDVLRQALGDQRLDYLGKSYGTFLGATYAELFPHHVGRLVLDGAVDPRLSAVQMGRDQAAGFEVALHSFLADCARRADCPLGTDPGAAEQRLGSLLTSLQSHPLTSGGRQVGEGLAETGIIGALYSDTTWPVLRLALRLALSGDGRGLLYLSDAYNDRGPDGHYRSNQAAANAAVNCLDLPDVTSVAGIEAQLPAYRQASPLFGAAIAWSNLACAYWPVRPTGAPHAITPRGAPTILVVGTTRDPATPYQWAQRLAAQLPGALLTYDGDGHTAYRRGSACVDGAVDAYLLRGTLPARGLTCS